MIRFLMLAGFILLFSTLYSQQADQIIGEYKLPNQLKIKIYKVDNKFFGKITSLDGYNNGQIKDIKNPDEAKRNDSLLGKVIIEGLKYDNKKDEWVDGLMYGPEKGIKFNLKITEIAGNRATVVGSKFFFWHTLTWQKL